MSIENLTRRGRRLLAKDFYVSNDTKETGRNNNDLLIGTPGSSKTGGYVSPNVLGAVHSMVVTDAKGILHDQYKDYLEMKGFKVVCVNFAWPEKSVVYNPMDYIERYELNGEERYRETDVLKIAEALMGESCRSEDFFWVESAKLILASIIAYILEALPKEEQNLMKVYELYTLMNEELMNKHAKHQEPTFSLFDSWELECPDSYACRLYKMYRNYVITEKMWGSIVAFVNLPLMNILSREMSRMLCGEGSFNLADIGREKTIVFLNINDADHSNDKMINLFYTQLFQCLIREADGNPDHKLKVPVRVILDDFGADAKIDAFDKIISVIRARDIYVTIVLQNLTQLEGRYNKAESETIISNCDQWIYLGGGSGEMINILAKKAGFLPESINSMDSEHELLFIRGNRPKFAEKEPAYQLQNKLFGDGKEVSV